MSDERNDLEDAIREYGFDYAYGRPTDQTAWNSVLVKIAEYGQYQRSRGYEEGYNVARRVVEGE